MAATLLLLLLALPLSAQQRYAAELVRLEEFINGRIAEQKLTGISVAIVKDDFRWGKGFGLADVENKVPATVDSSYRMASVTKPMTAVGVLKLVEQGKIDLDAEVQKYVPDFPKKPHPVTIRQLLGHLGGISHYRNYNVEGRVREPKNTKEALAMFQDFDLIAEPGTRYSYSSYGYNLLGAVIEGASGRPYGDFMRDEVWAPLGMTATRMDDPRALIPNRVRGYTKEGDNLRNSEYVDISSRFAGGGTRSTVADMLRFATGLEKILKPQTIDLMWTGLTTRDGTNTRYGLGWGVTPQAGRFYAGHSGSQQETRTDLSWFPREKFGFALASNLEEADLTAVSVKIVELFLGDSWNVNYYTGKKEEQLLLNAMGVTWNNGLAFYERYNREHAGDAAAAFRYFNEAVKKADEKMISEGRHRAGKESFIVVGAAMAQALAKSGARLETYHNKGELAFFDDYVKLYRRTPSIPRAHRFDAATEEKLALWRKDWERVWSPELDPFKFDALRDWLKGSSIIPDFTYQLIATGQTADLGKASQIAATLLALYPEADNANGFAGVLAIIQGDVERGKTLIAKSRALSPNGYGSAQNLARIATTLDRLGMKDAATILRGL